MLRHSINVHSELVDAISRGDRAAFDKVMLLHNDDLVRADDPRRSPAQLG
jgi:DNA-binding FadR family transcriptional regulator